MDWKLAIEMNRAALKRVLGALVATAGLGSAHSPLACRPSPPQGGRLAVATLPRHLHRAVLRVLRPAEAAARRLVIMAARGIVLPPVHPRRHKPKPPPLFLRRGDRGTGIVLPRGFVAPPGFMMPANRPVTVENRPIRSHSFRLLDPLPRFRPRRPPQSGVPRISCPGFTRPFPIVPRLPLTPDDPIDATRIALRLQALERALDDLPGHARRFARWRHRVAAGAREEESIAAGARNRVAADTRRQGEPKRGRFRRIWPLRMGRLPGSRGRDRHEVHTILADTHGLALWALADTS
jgi:hypothetical protein